VFFVTANYNLYVYNVLWDFIQKGTFGLLFFAVVRFSPPSPKAEAVKRKAEAKNNPPDQARGRAKLFVVRYFDRISG